MPEVDILIADTTWAGIQRVASTPHPPSYFEGRDGYQKNFLGNDSVVELPGFMDGFDYSEVSKLADGSYVLIYRHFSVVQCATHRQPFFSACNVDGSSLKPVPRIDTWSYDGRIPTEHQMLREAYGPQTEKRYSRGHQTRRQDPNWGSLPEARQANADTFVAPNACPQWQPFNDGIWGDLEDYVLDNADGDDKRVSIITGPYFDNAETHPIYGVTIPRDFWKVIAFISEETGELSAVAYELSQGEYLDAGVLVDPTLFNKVAPSSQISIARIESRTPLRFDSLRDRDVMADAGLQFAHPIVRLVDTKLPKR